MDLRLFWGVAQRYRSLALGGALLAVLLAVLAYGTPSFSHGSPTIVPHGSSTYESQAELLITEGTGTYSTVDPKTIAAGAPSYLASLSPVYAGMANGTVVQDAIRATRAAGKVVASEGIDPQTGDYTPFIDMTATSPSKAGARILITRAISSLQGYVASTEQASGVPSSERVQLAVIKTGLPPIVASGPKLTIPILVFLAVLAATIWLMFSLENRDPQTAARLGRVTPADARGTRSSPAGAPSPLTDPRMQRDQGVDQPAQVAEAHRNGDRGSANVEHVSYGD